MMHSTLGMHPTARSSLLVGIIGVAAATAYLAIGTFARKETVAG
jgi:hypothetical protein